MHYYVVVNWKQIPILVALEHLVEGGTAANIRSVIMVTLIMYGDLMNEKIVERVCVFRS
jgi:hypothetical protein